MKIISKQKVEVVKHNNDDLSVANIARVSFDKWNEELQDNDPKLINYLAENKHITPFFHQRFGFLINTKDLDLVKLLEDSDNTIGLEYSKIDSKTAYVKHSLYGWSNLIKFNVISESFVPYISVILYKYAPIASEALGILEPTIEAIGANDHNNIYDSYDMGESLMGDKYKFKDITLRLTMPIFVARQFTTHRKFATNEISRRYVKDMPSIYTPLTWRNAPDGSIKQGSGSDAPSEIQMLMDTKYHRTVRASIDVYEEMLSNKIAPEMARTVLPQSMMTTIIATGSVKTWQSMLKLRLDSHAQKEISDLATLISDTETIM